jgi:hypothetical protein
MQLMTSAKITTGPKVSSLRKTFQAIDPLLGPVEAAVILLSPVIQAARLNGPGHLPRYARPPEAAGRSVHVDWRELEADYQFTPSDETKSFIAGQLNRVTAIQHWRAIFAAARGFPVAHHGDQEPARRCCT